MSESGTQELSRSKFSVDTGAAIDPSHSGVPASTNLRVLGTLLGIAFVLWAFFAWRGYGARHAQLGENWYLGGVHLIEITLIREDKNRLACASDLLESGLHCGFHADRKTLFASPQQELVLQPYNTVKNELFLAAGLWDSPALQRELPRSRFTVTCNYHVVGVAKSADTRWAPNGTFEPLKHTVTFGRLSDCALPR